MSNTGTAFFHLVGLQMSDHVPLALCRLSQTLSPPLEHSSPHDLQAGLNGLQDLVRRASLRSAHQENPSGSSQQLFYLLPIMDSPRNRDIRNPFICKDESLLCGIGRWDVSGKEKTVRPPTLAFRFLRLAAWKVSRSSFRFHSHSAFLRLEEIENPEPHRIQRNPR